MVEYRDGFFMTSPLFMQGHWTLMKQKSARRRLRSISTVFRHFQYYMPTLHKEISCSHSDIHQTKLRIVSELVLNLQNTLSDERWRHTLQWWVQGSSHNSRRALLERFSIVRFKSINYLSLLAIINLFFLKKEKKNVKGGREGERKPENYFPVSHLLEFALSKPSFTRSGVRCCCKEDATLPGCSDKQATSSFGMVWER